MVKCNVCEKNSLLPEKFGSVNVCKICFMKANGMLWKRQYERYEDAEKQRCKALESANKQGFPQFVIDAINEFFINQMNSMLSCDCCGQPVQHLMTLGKANICRQCLKKIDTPAWQQNNYDDNEEVEINRQKVLKIAYKQGFTQVVIDGINNHFDGKIQKGLICNINGGWQQRLKVYDTYCELIKSPSSFVHRKSVVYSPSSKSSRTTLQLIDFTRSSLSITAKYASWILSYVRTTFSHFLIFFLTHLSLTFFGLIIFLFLSEKIPKNFRKINFSGFFPDFFIFSGFFLSVSCIFLLFFSFSPSFSLSFFRKIDFSENTIS